MPNDTRRLQCLFCDHAQTLRTRAGKHWTCKKCGEVNPGPAIMAALFKRFAGGEDTADVSAPKVGKTPAGAKPKPAASSSPAGRRKARLGATTSRATKSAPKGGNVTEGGNDLPTPEATSSPASGAANWLTRARRLAYGD